MSFPPMMGAPPGGPPGMPMPMEGSSFDPGAVLASAPQHMFTPDLIRQTATPRLPQLPPPPTEQQILRLADDLQQFWKPRDERMDADYLLYQMARAEDTEGPGEVVIRNTPYVTVEKMASMLGAQIPQQDVLPPHDGLRRIAQKQENLVRWMWEDWALEWQRNLHGWLQRDLAHFATLRGWVTARVTYDVDADVENGENPVSLFPVDPRHVYPKMGARKITAVVHRYKASFAEIVDEFPEAQRVLGNVDEINDKLEVIGYYDAHYHAVLVDTKMVKTPTPHGYGRLPWSIAVCNGSPVRASGTMMTKENHWVADVGPSIFHGARYALRQMNRLLSQLATSIAESANPALVVYHNPERTKKPEALNTSAGAVNYMWTDEKIEPVRKSPNPADVQPFMNVLMQDIEQATIPPVLWGAGGNESGFAISLLTGAAKDSAFGVVKALEQFMMDVNERALMIMRDIHQGEIGYTIYDQRGNWIGGETLTAEEIRTIGVKTRVRFRDIAPKDRAMLAQLAMALVQSHLISPETARDEYLGLEDPTRENERVLNSLIYQDEDIMKEILVPLSLWRNDPELFEVWATMTVHKIEEQIRQQQEQEQMQAAMGSVPGAAGMPPVPGMPPTAAPAQFGPEIFDALQQAMGSAAGGAGAGPLPQVGPPPG